MNLVVKCNQFGRSNSGTDYLRPKIQKLTLKQETKDNFKLLENNNNMSTLQM